MFRSILHISKTAAVIAVAMSGLGLATIQAAEPVGERGPVVKNFMSLNYRAGASQPTASHERSSREVNKLTAIAATAEDHMKLARYYSAKADLLDAQGAGYEETAAAYRNGPSVKNLMAPTTAARYADFAQEFRKQARAARALAASHREMARNVRASL
jgi:hypothetical protein